MKTYPMHTLSAEELRKIYPESDGKPMAENTLQFEWIALIKLNLEACFVQQPDVFIAADLFWYPVEGNGGIRVAPDVMVALGRPKGHRGSYIQFLEDNIAPQVIFEILSPGNTRAEMAKKLKFYANYGALEYYVYDPDHNKLEIYTRHHDQLYPHAYQDVWVSPLLQVKFEWTTETLLLSKPNGEPFLSYLELVEFHDQAIEALSESRQLLKQEQQKLVEIKSEKQQIQRQYEAGLVQVADALQRAQEASQKAEQERQKAEQERQKAEQERQKAEQERQKAEQEQSRVKNSIKAFQSMGLPNTEIASILGLSLEELKAYLIDLL
ncbi:Uma2 family endonuclease [Haliscomenobacter hydrossis]|nr:Uma2 family endonuclease [Haliscomenobacter hydrossis]